MLVQNLSLEIGTFRTHIVNGDCLRKLSRGTLKHWIRLHTVTKLNNGSLY